jgi:hypothetical protein
LKVDIVTENEVGKIAIFKQKYGTMEIEGYLYFKFRQNTNVCCLMLLGCFKKDAFSKKIKQHTYVWSLKNSAGLEHKKDVAIKAWAR